MKIKTIKVTAKGQISLPVDIRKEVGIREGDELMLVQKEDYIILEKIDKAAAKFKDLLKHSEKVAEKLWRNKKDEIWNDV